MHGWQRAERPRRLTRIGNGVDGIQVHVRRGERPGVPSMLLATGRAPVRGRAAALDDTGHRAMMVKSVAQLFAHVRADFDDIHLLVVDLRMPHASGIDLVKRIVLRRGEQVHLTPKEYGVLTELAKWPGRVLTHSSLLRAVWGIAHEQHPEYLRVVMRSLRQKLEDHPAQPRLLINEPAVGYRLIVPRADA